MIFLEKIIKNKIKNTLLLLKYLKNYWYIRNFNLGSSLQKLLTIKI